MLTHILAILATCFTIGRTWPQFLRIVVRKDTTGVSLTTWSLGLINHAGWLMYGILTMVPVFIVPNLFAAMGCAATVWILHSWQRMLQIATAMVLASVAIYTVGNAVLLTVITCATITVVVPQLWAVLRSPASGVSTAAWLVSAMSSISWISWAISVHRLTVVLAHFILLPAALVISARAIRAHQQPPVIDLTAEVVA